MKIKIFVKEIFRGKTIGRALLFATLKQFFDNENWLDDKFSILELGAESASHQRTFPKSWQVKKSNYIEMKDIDFVVDAEKPFSFKEGEFDGCVFFNVFSVINNYMNCPKESLRVSKRFIMFNVPLISGIARHPKDFNRFTEDRLIEIINSLKKDFKIEEFKIVPIGGSFSSAVSLIDSYLKFRIIRIPIYLFAILFDKLDKIIKRSCPIQYLVFIKKHG